MLFKKCVSADQVESHLKINVFPSPTEKRTPDEGKGTNDGQADGRKIADRSNPCPRSAKKTLSQEVEEEGQGVVELHLLVVQRQNKENRSANVTIRQEEGDSQHEQAWKKIEIS